MAGIQDVFTDHRPTREDLYLREISRLEALVKAEHNRGNEYLGMLHEAQASLVDLMAILHPNARTPESFDKVLPIGGYESPSAKGARLSRESFEKVQNAKKSKLKEKVTA